MSNIYNYRWIKGSKKVATIPTHSDIKITPELYEWYLLCFLELGFDIENSETLIDSSTTPREAKNMLDHGANHNQVVRILS